MEMVGTTAGPVSTLAVVGNKNAGRCSDTHTHTHARPPCITSVLWAEGTVVGTVAALLAEVDVSADAALQERLSRPDVVAHAQEDLVGLILTEEAQRVHL